jgi:hypothetical protein
MRKTFIADDEKKNRANLFHLHWDLYSYNRIYLDTLFLNLTTYILVREMQPYPWADHTRKTRLIPWQFEVFVHNAVN